jgi:hypothetical protein
VGEGVSHVVVAVEARPIGWPSAFGHLPCHWVLAGHLILESIAHVLTWHNVWSSRERVEEIPVCVAKHVVGLSTYCSDSSGDCELHADCVANSVCTEWQESVNMLKEIRACVAQRVVDG